MTKTILTSLKNPLIKEIRKLRRSKERRKQNLLVLEGTNAIATAERLDYPLHIVLYTEKWQESHRQLWQKISVKAPKLELVSPDLLSAIATTVSPDGVVATAVRQPAKTPQVSNTKLALAVERLQDPGNLGTIIRTAVATGVDGLWLSQDSVDFDNPKVIRASVGEWFRLPIAVTNDLAHIVREHQQHQIQVIATVPTATKTYWELDFQRPSLILLGNEGAGLSPELIALADEQVTIPVANEVESLNVAIANSLLLYEAKRQSLTI
ncbi:rRNA methylase [Xenococcus sp. PCC 7305]|uniref:TrmH family RNA methyltransferase n=1 Tax=Xenococcus sp. PCC 7305 TaxID=102125 RepID=UPI0002ACE4E1|nr:RNA methyltransferase [Xenococcus sp. PCC 7305]ELS01999.1 rRNA methylase [Xenococcus sp. PCC 7305]